GGGRRGRRRRCRGGRRQRGDGLTGQAVAGDAVAVLVEVVGVRCVGIEGGLGVLVVLERLAVLGTGRVHAGRRRRRRGLDAPDGAGQRRRVRGVVRLGECGLPAAGTGAGGDLPTAAAGGDHERTSRQQRRADSGAASHPWFVDVVSH